MTIGNTGAAAPGNYTVEVVGTSTTGTHDASTSDSTSSTSTPGVVTLAWRPPTARPTSRHDPPSRGLPVGQAGTYRLQVATDPGVVSPRDRRERHPRHHLHPRQRPGDQHRVLVASTLVERLRRRCVVHGSHLHHRARLPATAGPAPIASYPLPGGLRVRRAGLDPLGQTATRGRSAPAHPAAHRHRLPRQRHQFGHRPAPRVAAIVLPSGPEPPHHPPVLELPGDRGQHHRLLRRRHPRDLAPTAARPGPSSRPEC